MQSERDNQHSTPDPLQDSDALLRAMIENLPGSAAFVVDSELRYRMAGGEALATAGFKIEDFVGRTIFEALPPELAASYEPMYRQALAGEPFEHEHSAHHHTYLSRGTPLRSASGEVYGVMVVSYDITERKRVEDDRKQAEDALRESEARLQAVANLVPDLLWDSEPDGSTNWYNHRWMEYTGQTFEQAIGWGWIDVIHPDDREGSALRYREAVEQGMPLQQEHRIRRHDGAYRWFVVKASPLKDGSGKVIKMYGAATDIHDRKQTEDALRESEEKYRSLFNSMDEAYAVVEVLSDENGEWNDFLFLEINPAFVAQTSMEYPVGRKATELLGTPNPEWAKVYGQVAATGAPIRFQEGEATLGRVFDLYVFRLGGDGSRRVAVLFTDITDRKRREANLTFLADLMNDFAPLATAEEVMEMAGKRITEHLDLSRYMFVEIFPEAGTCTYLLPSHPPGQLEISGSFVLAEYHTEEEHRLLCAGHPMIVNDVRDGTRTPEQIAAFEVFDIGSIVNTPYLSNGRWVFDLGVARSKPSVWREDEIELLRELSARIWLRIERARAEVALRESEIERVREQAAVEQERQRTETLVELDRTKTLFFTHISHEFRTPLTLLLAPLQDALNDSTHPLDPVHRERLELLYRNSLRLLKLVNTLLDFSRIEAGRMEAVYEPVDLATFTADLASVFRSAIERAGLQLIVDCPPLPEPVFIDREMWEKIVLNLLSNAFKFTFEGVVTVRLRSANSNQAILQIQDTGSGIAPEHLPHLFERFYQVRGTQARTHEGSGIGLALVHELVRLLGGTLEVSSTVGEGTCFTITLTFGTEHLPSVSEAGRDSAHRLQDEGDSPAKTLRKRLPIRTLSSTAMGAATYVEETERWLPEESKGSGGSRGSEELTTNNSLSPPAHILIVDDNADMREYLIRILSEHVQVEAVVDGVTALVAATERVPDLILSDIMMPGLDGFELLGALRASPRTREVPIILLSARAGVEAIVVGLEAGADDYLIKPFSAQELVSRVLAHLQMAHLRGEALQEARSTIRSRDEFISIVSHELNTPLVSILGWTRLLRANSPSPTMLTKALDTIERNAMLQAKLVQDLLDISRIAAGKLRLDTEPVKLEAVIETAMATVTQMAQTKGIDLNWHKNIANLDAHTANSIVVMGDRDRLGQVICNLLSNAIKFTPSSGSVTIELSVIDDDHSPNISCARICVTDTGIGIAADFLGHVFERFRQARDSDVAKGMGLGLAIARHLVELHNGTISAQSAGVGQGATFTVKLPLCLSQ